jgi:hypothetical protein
MASFFVSFNRKTTRNKRFSSPGFTIPVLYLNECRRHV